MGRTEREGAEAAEEEVVEEEAEAEVAVVEEGGLVAVVMEAADLDVGLAVDCEQAKAVVCQWGI
jgi:hypothetical protein